MSRNTHLSVSAADSRIHRTFVSRASPVTTHLYVEAALPMKERALAKLSELNTALQRYRASDTPINFPKTL